MGDSKKLDVKTEFGMVEVHKMPLSDFAEILRALDNLPEKLGGLFDKDEKSFDDMDYAAILKLFPALLADSWSDIAGIIAVPTDKDRDFMLKLDGADALDVIDAILELNDFPRIFATIKKMLARRGSAKKATQPTPPPLPK